MTRMVSPPNMIAGLDQNFPIGRRGIAAVLMALCSDFRAVFMTNRAALLKMRQSLFRDSIRSST
jgi:hypothetical protein